MMTHPLPGQTLGFYPWVLIDFITVPGDSIMGLFATNLLKPLKVEIKAENDRDIKKLLEKYDQENITFTELEGEYYDGTERV